MNVAIFGKHNIAIKCTEHILKKKVNILFVVSSFKDIAKDNWQLSFKKFSKEKGLTVYSPEKVNSKEFIEILNEANIDFIFSFQYDQILGNEIITKAKKGAINLHFSLLPKNRGCFPPIFAILKGEKFSGVTLHYMDDGIDTGDIISQEKIEIKENFTGLDLYDKCINTGYELFKKTFPIIIKGKNLRIKQNDLFATYNSRTALNFKDNLINWKNYNDVVYNWIRAFIFPPFQYPGFYYKGREIFVRKIKKVNFDYGEPGRVVAIKEKMPVVSTLNGTLLLEEISDSINIKEGDFLC